MKYQIRQGEGFSFATATDKRLNIVTAYISVDVHDTETVSSYATQLLYPEILLSGAGAYTRAEFLSAVNLLGASINISAENGVVNFVLKSTAEVFPKLLSLFSIMIKAPALSKKELVRISATAINGLQEAREDSKAVAHDELINKLYKAGDRRYFFGFDATEAAIKEVTTKEIANLHKKVLHGSWVCSAASNEKTVLHFEKVVKAIKQGKPLVNNIPYHHQNAPIGTIILTDIPGKQNIDFSIGAPVPITLHHPDYIPLVLGLAVLGKWGGFTGRLMSTVREQEGLTYGIYAKTESFSAVEQGYWRVMTFFAPDKSLQGLTSTFREIAKMHEKGITNAELLKFKKILQTGQTLLQDSVSGMLGDLHAYHLQGFSLEEMATQKARIQEMTTKQVNAVLKKYLNPKLITVSAAGPVKTVKKDLQDFVKNVAINGY